MIVVSRIIIFCVDHFFVNSFPHVQCISLSVPRKIIISYRKPSLYLVPSILHLDVAFRCCNISVYFLITSSHIVTLPYHILPHYFVPQKLASCSLDCFPLLPVTELDYLLQLCCMYVIEFFTMRYSQIQILAPAGLA